METKSGQSDYGRCAGHYVYYKDIRGKPSFIKAGGRFLSWNGGSWVISDHKKYPEIFSSTVKKFGWFHISINGDVTIDKSRWNSYNLQYIPKGNSIILTFLCKNRKC